MGGEVAMRLTKEIVEILEGEFGNDPTGEELFLTVRVLAMAMSTVVSELTPVHKCDAAMIVHAEMCSALTGVATEVEVRQDDAPGAVIQ